MSQNSEFTSKPFTIYIGPNKTAYYVNRQILISKIPYFASLLSFPGLETTTTNSAHLDTSADTEDAFDMVLQYVHTGKYSPPGYLASSWKAQTHAEVYVMADRLLMEDLMTVAMKQMAWTLLGALTVKKTNTYIYAEKRMNEESVPIMDPECIIQVVRIIYGNTKETEGLLVEENDGKKSEYEKSASTEGGKKLLAKVVMREPMRALIARYCGSQLGSLRETLEFFTLLQENAEFAKDLLKSVSPGPALEKSTSGVNGKFYDDWW